LWAVRVVNIATPVDRYELAIPSDPSWAQLKQKYEKALAEFDSGNFRPAARILDNLRASFPDDGSSLFLLSWAINALIEKPVAFDPVGELPGK
jgi:hypothetical protein